MSEMKWPYPAKVSQVNRMEADVIVLGGGIAGCMAAINAAKRGTRVILAEKGAKKRYGSAAAAATTGRAPPPTPAPVFLRRIWCRPCWTTTTATTTASLII